MRILLGDLMRGLWWRWKAVTILLLLVIGFIVSACTGQPKVSYNDFAKCLTEKGAVMYGTFWCPKCAQVKKNFGDSFNYLNYVECDPRGKNQRSELCLKKGIDKYATFIINDTADKSTWLIGAPSMEQLAGAIGCPLPVLKT